MGGVNTRHLIATTALALAAPVALLANTAAATDTVFDQYDCIPKAAPEGGQYVLGTWFTADGELFGFSELEDSCIFTPAELAAPYAGHYDCEPQTLPVDAQYTDGTWFTADGQVIGTAVLEDSCVTFAAEYLAAANGEVAASQQQSMRTTSNHATWTLPVTK